METSNSNHLLLQKYRDDRRKLLKFLVSSGFIKEIRTPAGPTASISDAYFDSMSIDYVLECIQSGAVLDVCEARERYRKESSHPVMIRLQSGDTFYLYSDPESSGSPPRHAPPKITMNHTDSVGPCNFEQTNGLTGTKSPLYFQEARISSKVTQLPDINVLHRINLLSLGLPELKTGLLDDDLRESAYEVFLACILFSGFDIHVTDGRKREKSAKFLTGLKSRRYKRHIEVESPERHLKVLDTIRTQMQVIGIDGQFPGPILNVTTNWNVVINVKNNLDEPFLLTWNGIQQRKNSWQDGVSGTNCPIPPGWNWTYQFQVKDQIGSFFYFASLGFQKAVGGYGGITVNNRAIIPIPFGTPDGDITLLISDWYTKSHKELRTNIERGISLGVPDGILINGLGPYQFDKALVPDGISYQIINVEPGNNFPEISGSNTQQSG